MFAGNDPHGLFAHADPTNSVYADGHLLVSTIEFLRFNHRLRGVARNHLAPLRER